jgi:hypothetical protein
MSQVSVENNEKKIQDYKNNSSFFYILSVIPVVVMTYLQLAYNLLIVSTILNVMFKFVNVIEDDLQIYIDQKSHVEILNIMECTNHFINNHCGTKISPALEQMCKSWDTCMNSNPSMYRLTSSESAELFAKILNNFFENLSYKTIGCILTGLFSVLVLLNISLNWSRRGFKSGFTH